MNQWDKRFQEHQVHTLLKTFREHLDKIQALTDTIEYNVETQGAINRLETIYEHISSILSNCNSSLVSFPILENIKNNLQPVNDELSKFNTNQNTNHFGHIVTAANNIDNVLRDVKLLPRIVTTEDVKGVQEAVTQFYSSGEKSLSQFEKRTTSFDGKLKETESKIDEQNQTIQAQKTRLDQALSEFQSQTTDIVQKNTQKLEEHITDSKTRVFDTISELRQEMKENVKSADEELKQSLQEIKDESVEYIDTIKENKEHVDELVGLISRTGMAGGYEQVANEEQKKTKWWRTLSVLSMIGIVIGAGYTFYLSIDKDIDTGSFLSKALVSFACAILAAYAAREGEKHRRLEQHYRKLQLELSSIDPYLASLPEEQRNEMKALIANRLFGQPDVTLKDIDSSSATLSIADSLKSLRDSQGK